MLRRSLNTPSLSRYYSSSPALEWLSKFTNYEQKGVPAAAGTDSDSGFNLDRMHDVLNQLDAPHTKWPVVHVAGTKGKGSTVTMLSSILTASGYTVGTYTSPHITSLHERMAINGLPIPTDVLDNLVQRYGAVIEAQHAKHAGQLSHFEILTALAFKYFEEQKVDVAVVETGLGGVRDATNVFKDELLKAAVITAIGKDHAAALGGSLENIAAAKAGIMKEGRPAVIARQPYKEAYSVLTQHAEELHCPIYDGSKQLECTNATTTTNNNIIHQHATLQPLSPTIQTFFNSNLDIKLRLLGSHQIDNACNAITTAVELHTNQGFDQITPQSVLQGLEQASMIGRFQLAHFADEASDTSTSNNKTIVVLDGAHTEESASALVDTFLNVFGTSVPVAIVLAMADDKPHKEVCYQLRRLSPVAVGITQVAVAGGSARAAAPGQLLAAWQAAGLMPPPPPPSNTTTNNNNTKAAPRRRCRELVAASLVAAVERARMELRPHVVSNNNTPGVVLVCGSMHAVSAALHQLDLVV